jgi:hypothetical protein
VYIFPKHGRVHQHACIKGHQHACGKVNAGPWQSGAAKLALFMLSWKSEMYLAICSTESSILLLLQGTNALRRGLGLPSAAVRIELRGDMSVDATLSSFFSELEEQNEVQRRCELKQEEEPQGTWGGWCSCATPADPPPFGCEDATIIVQYNYDSQYHRQGANAGKTSSSDPTQQEGAQGSCIDFTTSS